MGRQTGVLPITGKVGGLTFFKTRTGMMVRERGGVSADRIRTDPAFERTRENGKEFGRASRLSRLLRSAFRSVVMKNADAFMTSRMSSAMSKIIKADITNVRGERTVQGANLALLQGFEFNDSAKVAGTFYAPFAATIDRPAGALLVSVPAFTPMQMITPPAGATHARLMAAGAEVNFTDNNYVIATSQSDQFVLDNQLLPEITLLMSLPINSTQPLFLAFGISFFQVINGTSYALKNGAYNALALVKIDGGV